MLFFTTDTEYLKALAEITVFDFIKELATKAYEQKVILEIPHQTFHILLGRGLAWRVEANWAGFTPVRRGGPLHVLLPGLLAQALPLRGILPRRGCARRRLPGGGCRASPLLPSGRGTPLSVDPGRGAASPPPGAPALPVGLRGALLGGASRLGSRWRWRPLGVARCHRPLPLPLEGAPGLNLRGVRRDSTLMGVYSRPVLRWEVWKLCDHLLCKHGVRWRVVCVHGRRGGWCGLSLGDTITHPGLRGTALRCAGPAVAPGGRLRLRLRLCTQEVAGAHS